MSSFKFNQQLFITNGLSVKRRVTGGGQARFREKGVYTQFCCLFRRPQESPSPYSPICRVVSSQYNSAYGNMYDDPKKDSKGGVHGSY